MRGGGIGGRLPPPLVWFLLAAAVEAPITDVTVYSDRARVVRAVTLPDSGARTVELPTLPQAVDRRSIRVEAAGAEVKRVEFSRLEDDALPTGEAKQLITPERERDLLRGKLLRVAGGGPRGQLSPPEPTAGGDFDFESDNIEGELRLKVEELTQLVLKLQEQLNRNSTNSSKPPASDSPDQRAERRGKGPTGGQRGGQPGHSGSKRELVPPEQVTSSRTSSRASARTAGRRCRRPRARRCNASRPSNCRRSRPGSSRGP